MKSNRKKQSVKEVKAAVAAREGRPVHEVILNVRADFRRLMLEGGLAAMQALFEAEIAELCGPRYIRGDAETSLASRWGSQRGVVTMGGQKVAIAKPRVRQGAKEVRLRTYEELTDEDPLNERALEQMVIGVSTRKYARSLETPAPVLERSGVSKSAVSRRFVAMTQAQLESALSEALSDREWVALLLDGIEFAGHVVVIAMGIDSTGKKHVLGLREGSTENATLCREMLSGIVARGVPADRSVLVVIDGGKGLRKAVTQVFGQYALVQRCQVHKRRNVLDQLPQELRPQAKSVMEQAYAAGTSGAAAKKQLDNLARILKEKHPGASASLLEGLEETLTIKHLGLSEALMRSLATTNGIENLNGTIRHVSKRVKRWNGGTMVLRWVATGVFEASRGLRRLRGHKDMPALVACLRQRDRDLSCDTQREAG
jgi:transposase-like protein